MPDFARAASQLLTAAISSADLSKTWTSGAGPLKSDTVALRCSALPSTSDTSGPSSRSASGAMDDQPRIEIHADGAEIGVLWACRVCETAGWDERGSTGGQMPWS